MEPRSKRVYLPSLLDRIADARAERRAREALRQQLQELDRALAAAGDDETLRGRLRRQRAEALDQWERLGGLTQAWEDIRECVRRDLEWLFNAHAYAPPQDLEAFPQVRRSVLNYGMPDLTGMTATSLDVRDLERRIEAAVASFEPRILRRTLKVHLDAEASDLDRNTLVLEIEGLLWAEPTPMHLRLRTQLDIEEDIANVIEFQA